MNDVRLEGRAMPSTGLKYLPTGKAVMNARLLVVKGWEKDGEKFERKTEVPLTLWGKEAERWAQEVYCDEENGTRIYVVGEIENRKRTNQKTGGEFDNAGVSVVQWCILDAAREPVARAREAAPAPRAARPAADGPSDLPFATARE